MADQITGDVVEKERDERGRFVKGHPKTGGRAKRATEIEYLQAVTEGISVDDVREGARKLALKLRKGDIYAWKLLLPYIVGLPIQRNEHSGADGEPIEIIEIIRNDSASAILDQE